MRQPARRDPQNDPDVLRERINGPHLLSKILSLAETLERGWVPEYDFPRNRPVAELTPEDFHVVDWVELRPPQLQRLKASLDVYMRLLNKVLPDLKSIDMVDSSQTGRTLSQVEMANRLYAAIRKLPNGEALLASFTAPNVHNVNPHQPPGISRQRASQPPTLQ